MQVDDAYLEAAVRLGFLERSEVRALLEEGRGAHVEPRRLLLDRGQLSEAQDQAILAEVVPGLATDFDLESDPVVGLETHWSTRRPSADPPTTPPIEIEPASAPEFARLTETADDSRGPERPAPPPAPRVPATVSEFDLEEEVTATFEGPAPERPEWLLAREEELRRGPGGVTIPMPQLRPPSTDPPAPERPRTGPIPRPRSGPIPRPKTDAILAQGAVPGAGVPPTTVRPRPPAPAPSGAPPPPPTTLRERPGTPVPAPGPRKTGGIPRAPGQADGPSRLAPPRAGPCDETFIHGTAPRERLVESLSPADGDKTDTYEGGGRHTNRYSADTSVPTGVQVSGPDLLFLGTAAKYEFGKVIGRGGMGEVTVATDRFLRRNVAIKTLLTPDRPDVRAKFLHEAKLTGQLEHPNIVPVHEVGTDADGRPFMAMKRIKGRSLRDILRSLADGTPTGLELDDVGDTTAGAVSGMTRLTARSRSRRSQPLVIRPNVRHAPDPEPEEPNEPDPLLVLNKLLDAFKKVCDAAAYAHNRKIIHRDIKPANIMVGEFGEVQLMDWGISKVHGKPELAAMDESGEAFVLPDLEGLRTGHGTVKGTPAYMAPEQARGEIDKIDHRTDIYALGGVLYSILTLEAPIERGNPQEMLARAARAQFVRPSERAPNRVIPRELEAVVMKAMHRDPKSRYQSALELRGEVDAYLHGRMLNAAKYAAWELVRRWARRHRRRLVLTLVALPIAIGLAFGGIYFGFRSIHEARVRSEEQRLARAEAVIAETEAEREESARELSQARLIQAGLRYREARSRRVEAEKLTFDPERPESWFEAWIPYLLELAQAIRISPVAQAGWSRELGDAVRDLARKAETAGDWLLAEQITQDGLAWGVLARDEAEAGLARARTTRAEVEARDRKRLDEALERIREAERGR